MENKFELSELEVEIVEYCLDFFYLRTERMIEEGLAKMKPTGLLITTEEFHKDITKILDRIFEYQKNQ